MIRFKTQVSILISNVPVLVHVAGDRLRVALLLVARHRLLLLVVEELIDVAQGLRLLPVHDVAVGHNILLSLDVLGPAQLGPFAQQRLVLLLDVDASAVLVVLGRAVPLLRGAADGLVQPVLVYRLDPFVYLLDQLFGFGFGDNRSNWRLCAGLESLLLFNFFVQHRPVLLQGKLLAVVNSRLDLLFGYYDLLWVVELLQVRVF